MMTLTVATPKPGYPLGQLLLHNIHGPLHAFVVAMFRLVSENDGWLRLPGAAAGTASVALLFRWLRPRFGSRAALWGALLLAVSPLHIHYSQELRNYSFALCFVLLSLVQLDRLMERWTRAGAVRFALCAAAALLSNFSAAFILAVQSVAFLRGGGWTRRALARWALTVALVTVLASPWIYRVTTYVDFGRLATPVLPGDIDVSERLRGDTTVRLEAIPYAFYTYSVGFTLGPSLAELHENASLAVLLARHGAAILWVGLLFGALLGLGLARAPAKSVNHSGGWTALEPLLYLLVPMVATLALNWQNAKAFNMRYVLVGLPGYLALLAVGLASLRRGDVRVGAGVAVLATCALSLRHHYFDPRYAKEDVRGATRAVEARLLPGECIFAPTVWQIVGHYQRGDAPVHYVFREPPELVRRQLDGLYGTCASFWYLRARPWVDDPDGRVLAELGSRYQLGERLEFAGVTALHYTRKN